MPDTYDNIKHVNAVLDGLAMSVRQNPAFAATPAQATQGLLRLMGDTYELCSALYSPRDHSSQVLCDMLQQLCQPGLIALLNNDQRKARSENTVLAVADWWMHHSPAGRSSTLEERRDVALHLRLTSLTPSYFFDVALQLDWLQISDRERENLRHFRAAGQHFLTAEHARQGFSSSISLALPAGTTLILRCSGEASLPRWALIGS